jgi:hypothetical protein
LFQRRHKPALGELPCLTIVIGSVSEKALLTNTFIGEDVILLPAFLHDGHHPV